MFQRGNLYGSMRFDGSFYQPIRSLRVAKPISGDGRSVERGKIDLKKNIRDP